jgi:hypothetical protein
MRSTKRQETSDYRDSLDRPPGPPCKNPYDGKVTRDFSDVGTLELSYFACFKQHLSTWSFVSRNAVLSYTVGDGSCCS